MTFHFEYNPVHFKKYVQENFLKLNLLPYPDYEKESFKTLLERLRGQVDIKVHESNEQFNNWVKGLERKYKILLPFIYPDLLNDTQRAYIIAEIPKILKDHKIVFAHLLHQCYSNNTFSPYWQLLTRGYKANPQLYNKYWTTEIQEVWSEYVKISENQLSFIGKKLLARFKNMEAVLDLYFVREDHAFYNELMLYVFSNGTAELYEQEEQKFINMLKVADNLSAQQLASGFISANALEKIENISYAILDKLNTHIKRPMYWSNISNDIRRAFYQWYLRRHIQDFFSDISQEHERFLYWEKFIPKMYDALVLSDKKTILFYFEDVVIMEILGTGAVYVYKINVFESRFGKLIEKYRYAVDENIILHRLEREQIRDKSLIYKDGWLTHAGDWQYKFDMYLKNQLGWEV